MALYILGDFGESVPWQIDQALIASHIEKINQLGATRCFTRAREISSSGQNVDCAGLAGIRAPGKGHLAAGIIRKSLRIIRACQELDLIKLGHGFRWG